MIDRRLEQEIEANRFAIELLAPRHLMRRHLHGIPDLARVVAAADALDLSREAAARRYVELHDAPCAVAFAEGSRLRYAERSPDFPPLRLREGDPLPLLPRVQDARGLADHEDADPSDWLLWPRRQNLVVQVLAQRDGYAIVMLAIEKDDDGVRNNHDWHQLNRRDEQL